MAWYSNCLFVFQLYTILPVGHSTAFLFSHACFSSKNVFLFTVYFFLIAAYSYFINMITYHIFGGREGQGRGMLKVTCFSQARCTRSTREEGAYEGPALLWSCPERIQSAQAKRYLSVGTPPRQ